ncbi:MAG TPA: hypothetical protein VJN70_01440 [Gemmatimonadaceae bacterium]|nr:hypothetical protein [Gemmatimonadaceae bacterium]
MAPAQVAQVAEVAEDVRVEVDPANRRHECFVVSARGERVRASAPDLVLDGFDERTTDAALAVSNSEISSAAAESSSAGDNEARSAMFMTLSRGT